MKTVFKKGMEVYDQVFFPDTNGKIVEIHNRNGKIQLEVKFFSRHRLEPLCMQSSFFYDEKGNMTSAWDRTCETPTLSTKPYKVDLQGFEQKAPVPTFEEVWDYTKNVYIDKIGNFKKYEGYPSQELANAFEALRKLIFLRDYYNEGWVVDLNDSKTEKYCIVVHRGFLSVTNYDTLSSVMSFKSVKIRDKFLEEQRELLEIAKPLL